MAGFYSLTALLAWLCYMAASTCSEIVIIQEPMTDKECYYEGDNATLSIRFNVSDISVPLDSYTIAWNTQSDGTGSWIINGSTSFVYKKDINRYKHDARWHASFLYLNRSVVYKMEVSDVIYHDETAPLYALIIKRKTDQIVNMSSVKVSFKLNKTCPQTDPLPKKLPAEKLPEETTTCTCTCMSSVTKEINQNISSNINDMQQTLDKILRYTIPLCIGTLILLLILIVLICFGTRDFHLLKKLMCTTITVGTPPTESDDNPDASGELTSDIYKQGEADTPLMDEGLSAQDSPPHAQSLTM